MPGVVVTTGVRSGPTGVIVAPSSTWFVVGTAVRGATDVPVAVTSLEEFETYYGGYDASFTLHPQVQTFFEEGGARAYVSRAVGASATAGTITLNSSGPTSALTLTAANPGAWSADLDAAVVSGTVSGFAVKLYLSDTLVYSTGDCATVAEATGKINASAIASIYATATSVAPADVLIVAAATAFSTGVDGTAPITSELVTALDLFDPTLGAGAVSIPGQYSTTAINGLLAHAVANNRVAIIGPDPADEVADIITTSLAYADTAGSESLAFFFPYVTIPGPSNSLLTIDPVGYVAAKRSLAHNLYGPWQAWAGLLSQADFVTGLASTVNKTSGDLLDEGRVNAIRVIQNTVRVYGARSASSDETNFRYITYRDLLNYVVVEAERLLEDLVFSTIDGRRTVFGRTEARLIGLLDPIRTAGGLFAAFDADGNQLDPGYSVEVSDALNPVAQLAEGLIVAKCGLRVSSVGDRIEVEVVKSNLTSSVV